MNFCKFPDCRNEAYKTWALVPLCKEHYESIKLETEMYYNGEGKNRLSYSEREIFLSIKPHIPWMKGEKNEVCWY